MTKFFYIINPLSFQFQKDSNLFKKVKSKIDNIPEMSGEVHRTFRENDVSNLIKHAVKNLGVGNNLKIFVFGGNDTVFEAVQTVSIINNPNLSLGIIFTGKENQLSRRFGSNLKIFKAIENIPKMEERKLEVFALNKFAFLDRFSAILTKESEIMNDVNILSHIFVDEKFAVSGILSRLEIITGDKLKVVFFSRNIEGSVISKSVFFGDNIKLKIPKFIPKLIDGSPLKSFDGAEELFIQKTANKIKLLF